ncbi:MAG: glycosyltransferase family 4 protein [Patescibacteria group bacterium]
MERYSADLIGSSPIKERCSLTMARPQINLWWWLPTALVRSLMIIIRRKINIVHVTDVLPAIIFIPFCRLARVNCVVTAHGLDVIWPPGWYQWLVRRWLPKADAVVAVSQVTAQSCRERGVLAERLRVIPNGIRQLPMIDRQESRQQLAESYSIKSDDFILISVGRLVARKNLAWFIYEAMPLLPQNVKLMIAGRGPEAETIKQAISQAKLDQRVFYLGWVSDDRRADLLAGGDLFIMPNRKIAGDMEGFGIVVLEAASYGLPIIASRIEGLAEAVADNVMGKLLPALESDKFAAVISELATDRQQTKKLSHEARQYVTDNYLWDNLQRRYRKLYESLKNVGKKDQSIS